MFGIKTLVAIRSLEADLRALRREFESLSAYVDDRLKLIRAAENRVHQKSAKLEEREEAAAAADGNVVPDQPLNRGLTPREQQIVSMIQRRRAGIS